MCRTVAWDCPSTAFTSAFCLTSSSSSLHSPLLLTVVTLFVTSIPITPCNMSQAFTTHTMQYVTLFVTALTTHTIQPPHVNSCHTLCNSPYQSHHAAPLLSTVVTLFVTAHTNHTIQPPPVNSCHTLCNSPYQSHHTAPSCQQLSHSL